MLAWDDQEKLYFDARQDQACKKWEIAAVRGRLTCRVAKEAFYMVLTDKDIGVHVSNSLLI